jgi:hypothetical protein
MVCHVAPREPRPANTRHELFLPERIHRTAIQIDKEEFEPQRHRGTKKTRLASAAWQGRTAIALSQGLILLTRNSQDFAKVPGLVIEDWTA